MSAITPWPALLAVEDGRSLVTAHRHGDGRLVHRARWEAGSPAAIKRALALALVMGLQAPRHAVFISDAKEASDAGVLDGWRRSLGLSTLRGLSERDALSHALTRETGAATGTDALLCRWLPQTAASVEAGASRVALVVSVGAPEAALLALLHHPVAPLDEHVPAVLQRIGPSLSSEDMPHAAQALATLCGLAALAGVRRLLFQRMPDALRIAVSTPHWQAMVARLLDGRMAPPLIVEDIDRADIDGGGAATWLLTGAGEMLRADWQARERAHAIPVLSLVRERYDALPRTERRVADLILADADAALRTATAELARLAEVSQPQVIRFCRSLGFDGVTDFRRELAGSLALGAFAGK
ncbi:hypothetical protein [Mitsuaria sp. 7]|uniref:hypothetical protein n=1 Tax=Mitsuaria sp. 7 TaxID=1658665 RepID=UPI0007DE0FEE|nr:hypothetical protein [Mitsuaria sp. 7]ANH67990.1 hypothetical protein ABE85_11160 [Mitsuaria sp. 7]